MDTFQDVIWQMLEGDASDAFLDLDAKAEYGCVPLKKSKENIRVYLMTECDHDSFDLRELSIELYDIAEYEWIAKPYQDFLSWLAGELEAYTIDLSD